MNQSIATGVGRRLDQPEFFAPWVSSRARFLRLCMRLTRGNVHEAEDLLSEACVKAMEAQSQGVAVENPTSYSTTIIVNLARDRRRGAASARSPLPVVETEPCFASSCPSPDQEVSAREGLERALRALERVPVRQRWALLLRAMGHDYSGIAEEMGTSEQNARKLVQVARAAVQVRG